MLVNIPSALHDQITDKARYLGTTLDSVVTVLLEYGLSVQNQREQTINELANYQPVAAPTNTAQQAPPPKGTGLPPAKPKNLGEMIFSDRSKA